MRLWLLILALFAGVVRGDDLVFVKVSLQSYHYANGRLVMTVRPERSFEHELTLTFESDGSFRVTETCSSWMAQAAHHKRMKQGSVGLLLADDTAAPIAEYLRRVGETRFLSLVSDRGAYGGFLKLKLMPSGSLSPGW